MAYTPHVNGPALISVGAQGTSGDLYPVGYTDAGPQISIEFFAEPIIADNGGPSIPVDYQEMGKMAKIQMALVVYDHDIFQSWFTNNQSGSTSGTIPELGNLIFANTDGLRVVIASPIDAVPWRFYYCKVDDVSQRPGTKYTTYNVSLTAVPWIYNDLPEDKVLWDHVAA